MHSILIFEDSRDTPISELLTYCYKNDQYDGVAYFAGGKDNLFRELELLYNEGQRYILFIDLLPDNYDAVKTCRRLIKKVSRAGYNNVYVIPVVCAEYYVLKAFRKYYVPTEQSQSILQFGNYRALGYTRNFENWCKDVLNSLTESCMHTINSNGGFYRYDCKYKFLTRLDKSWLLLSQYPVFVKLDSCSMETHSVNLRESQQEAIALFKKILAIFTEYGLVEQTINNYNFTFNTSKTEC